MKIIIAFFSATGNTGQIAKAIAQGLEQSGAQVDIRDVTPLEAHQQPIDMDQYDAAVFGSPIHSMRSPRIFREWLATLVGRDKPCAMFFTYGGFQVHPTHFDTRRRLEGQGFRVVASAEFPGAHTFNLAGWQAMADRPDQDELDLAADYGRQIYPRLSGQDASVVGELNPGPYTEEQLEEFEGFRFKMGSGLPGRRGEDCSMCMECQEMCPSGAMDAESGEADPAECILCLGCVKICPDEVLKVNDMTPVFHKKMEMDKETPQTLEAKKGKLYL